MNYEEILKRLKNSNTKSLEAIAIKRQLRELPLTERNQIIGKLEDAKYKSDNSDVNDVIDDIIQEFKPKK